VVLASALTVCVTAGPGPGRLLRPDVHPEALHQAAAAAPSDPEPGHRPRHGARQQTRLHRLQGCADLPAVLTVRRRPIDAALLRMRAWALVPYATPSAKPQLLIHEHLLWLADGGCSCKACGVCRRADRWLIRLRHRHLHILLHRSVLPLTQARRRSWSRPRSSTRRTPQIAPPSCGWSPRRRRAPRTARASPAPHPAFTGAAAVQMFDCVRSHRMSP